MVARQLKAVVIGTRKEGVPLIFNAESTLTSAAIAKNSQ
jgi:hypothetical protein